MSYGVNEESSDHEEVPVNDILIALEVEEDDRESEASTSQRPQRTRVLPIRLQDCEVVGDDVVTPYGELVHFTLLAGVEPIYYTDALKNKQWNMEVSYSRRVTSD